MKKTNILLFFLLFVSYSVLAASHYIRVGATSGTNTGASWANAWTNFSSVTWTRGDTYYVAGGTYNESIIIAKALSGTQWIRVVKANLSDNSGDAGWDNSYTNLVSITKPLFIDDGYIEFNGITGSNTNGHGFKIAVTNFNGAIITLESSTSNYKILNTELEGSGFSASSNALDGLVWNNAVTAQKGLLFSSNWVHNVTRNGVTLGGVVGTSWEDYGMNFQNNVISETGGCLDPDIHGQGLQISYATEDKYLNISGSLFKNIIGSAMIGYLGGAGSIHSESRIYNNIFIITDNNTYRVLSPGVIWSHDAANACSNIFIWNNSFYGIGNSTNTGTISRIALTTVGATGNQLYNNIFESGYFSAANEGVVSSNNAYYGNSGSGIPSGTPGQIDGSSTTFTSPTTGNLTLISNGYARNGGLDLSAYFTTDFTGTTRTVPWDIGAYESVSTIYYVRTDGNNSNAGTSNTSGGAWRTIAKAATSLSAGDIVYVQSGNYDETVTITSSGISGAPVTFSGVGLPRTEKFNIAREWVIVEGFDLTTSSTFYGQIHTTNNNVTIRRNTFRDTTNGIGAGIMSAKDFGGVRPTPEWWVTNLTISENIFTNLINFGLQLCCNNSLISSNRFDHLPHDAIVIWGSTNRIVGNVVTNFYDFGGNHIDFIQTWKAATGDHSKSNLIERNLIINSDAQGCNLEDGGSTNEFGGWIFRNNIFSNLKYSANSGIPSNVWINNTFYKAPNTNSGTLTTALVLFNQSGFHSSGTVISNNIFAQCGYNSNSPGFYAMPSTNIGISTGNNFATGWAPSWPTISGFTESNGINGGNPHFYSSPENLQILSSSPAVNHADTGIGFTDDYIGRTRVSPWDIGAYEYQGTVLEVGVGKAYSTISSALAAAGTNDVINVYDGVYTENSTVSDDGVVIQSASGNTPSIVGRIIIGANNVTVRNMSIGNWTNANAGGVHSYGYSGLTVENCTITNATNSASGIYTRNGGNILIRSNLIAGCATGVNINSATGTSYTDGVRVLSNIICSNTFDGLDIHGKYITISSNQIFRNFDTNWLSTHPDGIQLIDSTIDSQRGCQNVQILNNTIYSHPQNIFTGYWVTNLLIANNILYQETGTVSGINLDTITTKQIGLFSGSNILIANNTLIRAVNSGIYCSYDASQATGGVTVKNNIITGVVSNGIALYFVNSSDIAAIDYNLYYGNSYDARIAASYYNTVGDFASATAYEDHGINGNPLLNNFIPQAGSPVINSGTDLSAYFTTDFTGTTRIVPWNIGAYETFNGNRINAINVNVGRLIINP